MMREQYAFMTATTAMYSQLCRKLLRYSMSRHGQHDFFLTDGTGKACDIAEIGPNLFNGNLVMAWKKGFRYGPILNY